MLLQATIATPEGYLPDTGGPPAKPKRKQTTRWRKVVCTVPDCAFSARMTKSAFERVALRCPDGDCSGALMIHDKTEEA